MQRQADAVKRGFRCLMEQGILAAIAESGYRTQIRRQAIRAEQQGILQVQLTVMMVYAVMQGMQAEPRISGIQAEERIIGLNRPVSYTGGIDCVIDNAVRNDTVVDGICEAIKEDRQICPNPVELNANAGTCRAVNSVLGKFGG